MKRFLRFAAALFFAVCLVQAAGAATIDYNLTNIGGDRWQYDYTITNTSSEALYGFSIYFDFGLNGDTIYSDLALEFGSASWDEFEPGLGIWQDSWMLVYGDPFAYNPGEFSALSLDAGLAAGGILEALSISFNWAGTGTPGSQRFALFDSDFAPLDIFGNTSGDIPPEIPEPQTLALLGSGLWGLIAYYRRNKSRKAGKR